MRDDSAVTPVIGTIMIMGIMVVGMAGMLLWGVPIIQAIQDQGALAAMEGEFATLRTSTDELRVRDASRVPVVSVQTGELGFRDGSRTVFTAVTADAPNGCTARLAEGWFESGGTDLALVTSGCPGLASTDFQVQKFGSSENKTVVVTGNDGSRVDFQVTGHDLRSGSWRLQFEFANGVDTDIYVFIMETNRLAWALQTESSDLELILEGGALFQKAGERVNLLAKPLVYEDIFGSGDYVLKYPVYVGPQITYSGPINLQAGLTLGANTWSLATEVQNLRYDFDGDLAEGWCNTMLLRNNTITAGTYEQAPGYECATGSSDGIRAVTYSAGSNFQFELMTPRIHASLNI